MSLTDWSLTERDLREGEWFRWDTIASFQDKALMQAVTEFEAHDRNPAAARAATEWFIKASAEERACVTRVLVAKGHVAAFYAIASGEITLTSGKKLRELGIQGSPRVGSSHVEWIARDRRAPGAGKFAIWHAIAIADRVAALQGNRALTMDPYDAETQEMWKAFGLRLSRTTVRDGLRRLYIPLAGPGSGDFKQSAL
jgi:hypothetical protein